MRAGNEASKHVFPASYDNAHQSMVLVTCLLFATETNPGLASHHFERNAILLAPC